MNYPWHWSSGAGHSYLTTELLSPWPHGFFTAQSWPQTPDGLTSSLATSALAYRPKQVHGNRIVAPPDFVAAGATGVMAPDLPCPEADGVMSQEAGQGMWVCSADCTPVLMGDRATGQVVAIHAGWRGTAQNIVPLAIARLVAQGSQVSDLRVALGPAIGGEVYQVGVGVAIAVGRSLLYPSAMPGKSRTIHPGSAALGSPEIPDAEVLAQLQSGDSPALLPDPHPGRVRLDVRRVLARQLTLVGLRPDQVAIAPHCTYREPERFFSYRRTQEKKVQWSGIVSC